MISLPPGGSSAASRQTRLSFFPPKIDIDLTRPEGNTYGEQAFFRGSTAGWVDVMCLLSGVMDLGRFLVPGDTYSPWISYCTPYFVLSTLPRCSLYRPAGTISPSLTMPCGGNGPSGSLLASAVAAILFSVKYPIPSSSLHSLRFSGFQRSSWLYLVLCSASLIYWLINTSDSVSVSAFRIKYIGS